MLERSDQKGRSPRGQSVGVVSDLAAASSMLRPLRLKILEVASEPQSATGLARRLKMPRQRLNYHLRELERAGLVELVKSAGQGNCIERFYQATARYFLVGPEALGRIAPPDPPANQESGAKERFSWAYLVQVLGKGLKDLASLRGGADKAGKPLATYGLHTEIRFGSPGDLNKFAAELTEAVGRLSAKYHNESLPKARSYTLFLGSYPTITRASTVEEASQTTN